MQFIDLQKQYLSLKPEIDAAVQSVLCRADFILGQEVGKLEQALADFAGTKFCITCANGTDALTLALQALKVGVGDAVFVPAFTFFATAETVAGAGATPIFVDCSQETFNIDCDKLACEIETVIGEGRLCPKAIIPVDLFGLPADYRQLEKLAAKYGLEILEDGAQGFGGSMDGRRACSFGRIATTSFFPAKPLGCFGDGGAIFTDDDGLAAQLKSLRFHGKGADKYDNVRIGYNSRLDTVQAAVLLVKLKAFSDYELSARNAVAERYTKELSGCLETPRIPSGFYSSWAQYTLRTENRDGLQAHLKDKGIPSMVYYPKGLHRQTALIPFATHPERLGATDKLSRTVLSLPMHPYLSEEEQSLIIKTVKEFC